MLLPLSILYTLLHNISTPIVPILLINSGYPCSFKLSTLLSMRTSSRTGYLGKTQLRVIMGTCFHPGHFASAGASDHDGVLVTAGCLRWQLRTAAVFSDTCVGS